MLVSSLMLWPWLNVNQEIHHTMMPQEPVFYQFSVMFLWFVGFGLSPLCGEFSVSKVLGSWRKPAVEASFECFDDTVVA